MPYKCTILWVLLVERKATKEALRMGTQLSSATMARMSKDINVSLDVLDKICDFLHCRLEDIIEHVPKDTLSVRHS